MKAKKILKTSASIGLVVPQVACAGAGMTLGGLQMGFQALADGTGYLKTKCYNAENRSDLKKTHQENLPISQARTGKANVKSVIANQCQQDQ